MITYKIRDTENKIYVHNMIFGNNHLYQTDSFGKFNIISDQSRYTIEREISDDVLEKICYEYSLERDALDDNDKDRLKRIIKSNLS